MSERDHEVLQRLGEAGLRVLDQALEREPPPDIDRMAEVTRCAAALRDALITAMRAGDPGAADLVSRANIFLSDVVAAEFPLAGERLVRVAKAREFYQRLVADL